MSPLLLSLPFCEYHSSVHSDVHKELMVFEFQHPHNACVSFLQWWLVIFSYKFHLLRIAFSDCDQVRHRWFCASWVSISFPPFFNFFSLVKERSWHDIWWMAVWSIYQLCYDCLRSWWTMIDLISFQFGCVPISCFTWWHPVKLYARSIFFLLIAVKEHMHSTASFHFNFVLNSSGWCGHSNPYPHLWWRPQTKVIVCMNLAWYDGLIAHATIIVEVVDP